MKRRTWLGLLAVAGLGLAAGSGWAGWALANAHAVPKKVDCCLDPTCPPGCSPDCPPNCLDLGAKDKACCPECEECP